MGIMVFGLGKFENISIETLIKEYSKKTDFKKLKNIINIKNDFLRYLTEVTQATNINIFLDSHLKNFKQMINQQRNSCNELEFYQFIETFSNVEIFEFLKDILKLKNTMKSLKR